ncbi:MAG: glycine cleavage system protein GcvH [Sphaerochaetaceae bacterium]|nr:glycine cleavage system protein GcvH [Sphaerochaetaceae bacterium]
MSKIIDGLLYTKDHEWLKVEGTEATVGITDYAQTSLGEIVYVELPVVDDEFSAKEEIANVESVKAASAIYSPVSGTVSEVNEELSDNPELLNKDSYSNFIFKLKDIKMEEDLLDAEAYREYLKTLD